MPFLYPFRIELSRFTLATKKNKDASQTCLWDLQPSISKVKADSNQVVIETINNPNDRDIRLEYQFIRSEHSGSKQRYQVKYCAVITLLKATKEKVERNNAKVKS